MNNQLQKMVSIWKVERRLKSKNYVTYPQSQGSFPKGRTSTFLFEAYKPYYRRA